MMTPFAKAILNGPASRAATYTHSNGGAAVHCRVLLNDAPGKSRRESGEEIVFDDTEIVVSDSVPVEIGGEFSVEGAVYRVVAISLSRAPGLLDVSVVRTSGNCVDLFDLSPMVSLAGSEVVKIDGREVRAIVSRQHDDIDTDHDGVEVFVQRHHVGVRSADAAGVRQGSVVSFDNHDFFVVDVRRTGAGLTTIVCRISE